MNLVAVGNIGWNSTREFGPVGQASTPYLLSPHAKKQTTLQKK
jgi:hypothetical protein